MCYPLLFKTFWSHSGVADILKDCTAFIFKCQTWTQAPHLKVSFFLDSLTLKEERETILQNTGNYSSNYADDLNQHKICKNSP